MKIDYLTSFCKFTFLKVINMRNIMNEAMKLIKTSLRRKVFILNVTSIPFSKAMTII